MHYRVIHSLFLLIHSIVDAFFFLVALLPVLIIDLDLSDAKGGLLQSSFVFSLIAFGPIIGFSGDRYSRRFRI